ncbi:calmodulin-binding transcription activator 2 isoform X5 [Eurytemora carolleeae]|uniref:calmodulin-binding transcription activator 2 isoform X5 n=1 Tax=Eurytemora carolleeae TaxID=1294199 RepID=UPI000C793DE1|nr:calmodulin-binding transcription activator 2 isoform X5 [Eurytemora carolleeae]XP_023344884.1 calmodulin-binding transcription activator 2 isoform X5 [Eurytemora carolleeae]|eukprot:XP_023344878.1 calmodulin-binding transcription activator 2-like isoform X5 [Eurytemora affinis]
MERGLYKMGCRLPVTTYYRTMSIDNKPTTIIIGPNGEPIKLPESLESLPKSDNFPTQRHRWNTNEEIASMLIAFDKHHDWMSKEVKIRPKSGSMLLYSRKKVRYRRDGYCWKKRKDGKTTREDHMKLKVQGMECIYGCYVHSAILPTFHRRCYWLLQNPDIVLVHYLNVPYPDDNKLLVTNSVSLWGDKKEWTKEELVSQLKPMFFSEEEPDINSEMEISTAETVEAIVVQLLEKQRTARTLGHMECSCPDSTCLDSKTCVHQATKPEMHPGTHHRSRGSRGGGGGGGGGHHRHLENMNQFFETDHRYYPESSNYSQVSSTTGNHGMMLGGERHSPGSGHSTPSRGHTPLVLSLSQLQGSAGLVILNSNSGPTSTTSSMSPYNRQISPPITNTPSPRPLISSCEADISSATRGEVGSVSAAVNTLTNIHEFSLDLNNGNFDTGYSGLQPVTDSLLSGSESRKSDEESIKSESDHGPLLDFKSAFSDLENKNDMSFIHETLDLTHDDLHRTLSANLPSCSEQARQIHHQHQQALRHHQHHQLNSMEYQDPNQQAHHNSFDVNLDAFDILSDFPELAHYEGGSNGLINSGHPGPMLSQAATNVNSHIGATIKTRTLEYRENLVTITDYSPSWSYTDGQEKVLITGPWYSQSSVYQILFDGEPVPTTLVQSGVLRCYCPDHPAGDVKIEVACGETVICKPVIFKYKPNLANPGSRLQPFKEFDTMDSSRGRSELDLKRCLLSKLEKLEICSLEQVQQIYEENFTEFEDQLVTMCQKLTTDEWGEKGLGGIKMREEGGGMKTRSDGLDSDTEESILHLAASLGLSRLVCSLLHWAAERPGKRIGREVDALAKDGLGYTPLMLACREGRREVATILYHWNSTAATMRNKQGQTCAEVAGGSRCPQFKEELEKMERMKKNQQIDSCSVSKHGKETKPEFLKPGNKFIRRIVRAPSLEGYLSIPGSTRRSPSPLRSPGLRSVSASVRSLRAGSPAQTKQRKLKQSKRPSVDSGINIDMQPVKTNHKEARQLSKNDRSLSLPCSGFQRTLNSHENITIYKILPTGPEKQTENSCSCDCPGSPIIDIEGVSSEDENDDDIQDTEDEEKVFTLAEQFLAAMPDRIKFDTTSIDDDDESMDGIECYSAGGADCCSEDLGVESMADDQSVDFEFNFEEACHSYRDPVTPNSSLSPASFSVESPRSALQDSPSPNLTFCFDPRSAPTTAGLSEFLQAKCEKDLSNLTLNEREQRELYQAAQIIQKAYRSYKGRKKSECEEGRLDEETEKEARAAVLIQNYYRRYKQYCYWKQMAAAASVIQKNYRNYCEHKRFRKNEEAATCIQTYYRNYRDQGRTRKRNSEEKEGTPTSGFKRTICQRRQNQAARKIQQFMRRTHLNTINEVLSPRSDSWCGMSKPIYQRRFYSPIFSSVAERPGCYGCRKREAPDPRHAVPAKLPGHTHPHYPTHPYMFQGWGQHSGANKI